MKEYMEEIQIVVNEYNEAKNKFKIKMKEHFNNVFKYIFNNNEVLESFSWTQATPYFNDGDVCVFRVHIDDEYLHINGLDFDEFFEDEKLYPIAQEISKILFDLKRLAGNGIFLDIFGDHASIIVSRNGDISIEEYEHA